MSEQPPRLPPGISVQKSASSPAPRLPPGISMQRSSQSPQMPKLPSGIQIQRSSDSNMDRLAGLGIQVSRSAEERPPPAANNDLNRLSKLGISVSSSQPDSGSHEVQSRLSGLGVSVSGGPKPPATNAAASRLPPGISVSGGLSPVKNLPPGVSHSGGPSPSKPPPHPTARAPPNLPPGISLSGGARPGSNGPRAQGPGPRPSIPGGVSINSGTRPATTPRLPGQPPSVRMNAATRPQAVNSFPSKVNSVLKQPDIAPTLPSGVSLSVGPSKSQSPSQPPAASAPSVPSGISLSGGPSQSQPPLQAPSAPAPTLPPGVSLSGGPSQSPSQPQAKSPEQRPAASAPSLPPEVSLSSGPSHSQPPPGDSGDDVSNKVPTTSPTVSAPESESKPPEPERSKSPAETLSDIDKFVNESNQECEVNNKSEEPSACEQEINSGEETSKRTDQKELPDSSPTVEESMELDENQEDLNPESNPSTDINGEGKVHKNTTSDSAANVEKSAGADSEELKEADDTETEKSNNENQNDASVNGETGDDSEAGEGAENWDEYEGEDGWEGYEEGYEGYDGEEGYEGYEDWEEYEEDGQTDNSEKGEDGSDKKASDEDKKDTDSEEVGQDSQSKTEENGVVEDSPRPETADESNSEQMDCDDDGAPKPPGGDASGKPAAEAETARRSQDEDSRQAAKLPPGISMSQVPSLPPGISISSPGKGAAAPPNLPPGISISPFKKPSGSGRQSVDEDARSQGSSRDEDAASAKSFCEGEDPVPLVGTDTLCVFCMERCSGNSPKLLTCLMSSCANCFSRKIRESIRDNSANDVVDLDGNDIQMAPEVTCTVCKSTTSEDEVMDNVFAAADPEEDLDSVEDEQHPCNSCEDNVMASHYCEDCDEYLCSDCVRAHQRVKMTKDHKIRALKVSGRSGGLDHLNYCSKCPNEKLTLYCETCDKLNCRDCQLSEQCRHHKYRYSYEVAPEVKAHLSQSVSDIRLKKSGLEESRQVLSSKIADVNAKENALIVQMREIKSYLIAKIETRHKELVTEISKICREKRKILEGRKSTLDRTYWQADYSISFVNNLLSNSVSDEKILLTKKMLYRQMKRMRRANNAVGLTLPEMELKLDLYFQHFTSQSLHTNLDNVLKMVMSDIKVSQVPIEAPKPKPLPPQPQPPPQPSPVRAAPSTPTRALPGSPQSRLSSPARLNAGLVSRQLSTPQKQVVVRGSPIRGQQGVSPARQVQHQRGQMVVQQRGGPRQLVQHQPGRGRGRGGLVVGGAVRGGHVRSLGQPGSVVMGRGGQMMQQGRGRSSGMRGGMMAGGGAMVRQAPGQRMVTPTKRGGGMVAMVGGRGAAIRPVLRGGVQGHVVPGRGGVQMVRGGGSLARQQAVPARRGRPPATGVMMNPKPLVQPQQFQQQQQYPPQQRTVITQQQRKIAPQPPQQPQPRAVSPSSSSVVSSWHTPSQNRPVSPPKSNDNFKIKLPKMSGPAGSKVKPESIDIDDDIISLDDPPPPRVNNGHNTITNFNRPGLQISRGSSNQEEGVDPLSLDDMPRAIKLEKPANSGGSNINSKTAIAAAPDFSSLMDDEISTTGDWTIQKSGGGGVKVEGGARPAGHVMEGSAKKSKEGEWCAVCHDGGDTLYCCDRCPNVFHMFCYIPPLTQEPADDWICLLCSTPTEIFSLPNKIKKGGGKLGERDLQLCRRLLFEMYNMWPESVPFRDCADLNFPAYLDKIKEPIALDVIKEMLDEENPQQYSSVRSFLADLRKMFRNCFTFNLKESEIYKHAKKLEDKLDKLLEVWAPNFVGDPLIDESVIRGKRPASPSSSGRKEKKKKGKKDSDDDIVSDDSDEMTEQERQQQQYLAALHASMKGGDADPSDGDFDPRSGKSKRGRPRKR